MKYPKFLSKNGKIGVCAPSFGSVIEPYVSRLNNAIKNFSELGHEVVLTDGVKKQNKAEDKRICELYPCEKLKEVYKDGFCARLGGDEYVALVAQGKALDTQSFKLNNPTVVSNFNWLSLISMVLPNFVNLPGSQQVMKT